MERNFALSANSTAGRRTMASSDLLARRASHLRCQLRSLTRAALTNARSMRRPDARNATAGRNRSPSFRRRPLRPAARSRVLPSKSPLPSPPDRCVARGVS